MTEPAKSQEPSMEEILASIRRIIADDDATKSSQRTAEAPKPVAPPARPAGPPVGPAAPAAAVAPPEASVAAFESSPLRAAVDSTSAGEADEADHSSDILDLTESMASPPSAAAATMPSAVPGGGPQFRTIGGDPDVIFDEATEKPASQSREFGGDGRAQLLSADTRVAVDSAFNALAQTVLVQNARTLEDLVREMLRPMLKAWLDDNLPGVVERLVRIEIERVSRGRVG
jgi:uncharacterized protein